MTSTCCSSNLTGQGISEILSIRPLDILTTICKVLLDPGERLSKTELRRCFPRLVPAAREHRPYLSAGCRKIRSKSKISVEPETVYTSESLRIDFQLWFSDDRSA
jgi:hypothetical protein